MTTKDQERKALEQIRKIVAGLGENSYVGTAFEGCFEIAEDNIRNDFACSMKQRLESAEFAEDTLRQNIAALEAAMKKKDQEIEELKEDCTELNNRIAKLRDDKFKAQRETVEARKDVTIKTADGEKVQPFAEIRYIDNNGFRFINVVEESGWVTSYKMDDLQGMTIA